MLVFLGAFGATALSPRAVAAPQYQKAKTTLRATVLHSTPLQKAPRAIAKAVRILTPKTTVFVVGRKGRWLEAEVEVKGTLSKGWVLGRHLKVWGPAKRRPRPKKPAAKKTPEAQFEAPLKRRATPKIEKVRFRRPNKPYRLVATGGYGYGAKDFPNQFRGGFDILYNGWPRTEVGGSLTFGVKNVVLIGAGPTLRHSPKWPHLGPVRTAIFGGIMFYYATQSSQSDVMFGPRLGADLLFRIPSKPIDLLLRGGADVMMLGRQAAAVPVFGLAGVAFRF